ncbi:venom acid phosphatase Acph-1-like [Nilaparvata lugens]|uniref:venom acid phosphatase Acph-1-like n=1 Tax=Nilaparvata lugens TaxID=108931 RepID=UPI00193EA89C|nr:venom acid phosphatase Acph-1-like [Nilaparvata lugens]XP_039284652.1 venom acid phosphatase Acph-1-like [Nilaparvata lugens]
MSMQLVLAGLFPPTQAQKWNKDLNWQPIPYQYEPLSQDKLLLVNTPCEVHRYNEAMDEVMKLEEVKQLMKENEPTFELLTNMTGMEVKEFNNLLLIQGILKAQAELNLKLPNWTEKVYPEPLNQLAAKAFSLFAYTPELRRIKGGPLLRTILEHLTDKSNNSGKNQLYLYAAHDNTIANLLNALRVWKEHIPDYNAMILIELHQLNRNNLHAVKIFYRKSENHKLDELKLSGCGEVCSLEEIQHLTRDVIATDSTKHCIDADFDKLFGELLPGDLGGIEYLPNGRGRGNFFKNTNLKQDFSKTFLGDGL